jgi:arsenate reductase
VHAYLDRLKAASDETRLRILRILDTADEALCVCELVDILRKPQYAVSRALATLRHAGVIREERRGKLMLYELIDEPFNRRLLECLSSIPPDDDTFSVDADRLRWRLDLRREGECVVTYTAGYNPPEYQVTAAASGRDRSKPKVLFICVHNSARSQMAEEYLRRYGGDLFDVESAGLEPGKLNPYVVEVLKEDDIDISGKETRSVVDLYASGRTFSYVITVCNRKAEEKCPMFPGPVERISWPFPDPSTFTGTQEEILARTRRIRDVIRHRVQQFVDTYRESQPNPTEEAQRGSA